MLATVNEHGNGEFAVTETSERLWTYVSFGKQCPAVRTQRLPIREPPHARYWKLTPTPKIDCVVRVPACSGYRTVNTCVM